MNANKKATKKPATPANEITAGAIAACQTEADATAFLELLRWNGKAECPRCRSANVYAMQNAAGTGREPAFRWRCREKACHKKFSVRTGTPMERTNIPLRVWLQVLWLQVTSKKGIPSLQIARMTGLSYKSALFLTHRVRHAVSGAERKLTGDVEADESYFGGVPRKANNRAKPPVVKDKMAVVGIVERGAGGLVRAKPIAEVTAETLAEFVTASAQTGGRLFTDDLSAYRKVGRKFRGHRAVIHSAGEYARRSLKNPGLVIHTNTIEAFWSLLTKRIGATHHAVSAKHLEKYIQEACFHWNTRGYDDGDRLRMAVIKGEGKHLAYQRHVAA